MYTQNYCNAVAKQNNLKLPKNVIINFHINNNKKLKINLITDWLCFINRIICRLNNYCNK